MTDTLTRVSALSDPIGKNYDPRREKKKETWGKEWDCCYWPAWKLCSSQFKRSVMSRAAFFWIDKAAVFNTNIFLQPEPWQSQREHRLVVVNMWDGSLTGNLQQKPKKAENLEGTQTSKQ